MGYGIIFQFDESSIVDGWEIDTLKAQGIHTDDVQRVLDELPCEDLAIIAYMGEDMIPVYEFTGDPKDFAYSSGHDIGRESFQDDTGVSPEEYDESLIDAKATHLEIIGPKEELQCGPLLIGSDATSTFKPPMG